MRVSEAKIQFSVPQKWFFSAEEVEKFILYRSAKNGMKVV